MNYIKINIQIRKRVSFLQPIDTRPHKFFKAHLIKNSSYALKSLCLDAFPYVKEFGSVVL